MMSADTGLALQDVKRAMLQQPDEIDNQILSIVEKNPGISILSAIKPLRHLRSESVLRTRVFQLSLLNLIRMEKTKHQIMLFRNTADGAEV